MKLREEETIAAIATAPGDGAIAIVRVSGPAAISIAERILQSGKRLQEAPGYSVVPGYVIDGKGEKVDRVLATLFRSPKSYTGEDTVELSCHGGQSITRRILELVIAAGAAQALPGEFTKRAFLNGKIDLSQAEAIAELISSSSLRAQQISMENLSGKLGSELEQLAGELQDVCGLLELELDFLEEGLDLAPKSTLLQRIRLIQSRLSELLQSYTVGRMLRDGVRVAFVGKPNAGKSSIFNSLLGVDRAIVSAVPGTTRDTIEESIQIDGVLFTLVDSAGLRSSSDLVEAEGISRALRLQASADLIAMVIDASEEYELPAVPTENTIIVLNKKDLLGEVTRPLNGRSVFVSALTGDGLGELKSLFLRTSIGKRVDRPGVVVTNSRHFEALTRTMESLEKCAASIEESRSNEFVALDLRAAINSLGEITGRVTTDDIMNRVFANFCIGK